MKGFKSYLADHSRWVRAFIVLGAMAFIIALAPAPTAARSRPAAALAKEEAATPA